MLKDYIKQIRGVSYKPTDILDKNSNNAVPIVRANNIQERGLNFDDLVYIDKSKVKDEQYLQAGDIVICASSGSKDLVGKAAYCLENKKASFGAFCKVVRTSALHKKYLSHFFQSDRYRREISESSKGANINNIRNEDIDNLQIIVPSIEEQQRIADELDKVNGLIEKRQKQLEKLDLLIKSRFVEMFGDTENNIYKQSTFGEEFIVASGGTPSTQNSEYWDNGEISWIGSNLCQNIILQENDGKFITESGLKHSSAKVFDKNTILIALVGATIGKVALLKFQTAINQNIAGIVIKDSKMFSPYYVFYSAMALYPLFMKLGGDKFKMANLSFIRQLPIMVPPIELQNQFADFVEKVEQNKSKIKNSLDKLITLKKALMQKYFG